MATPEHGDAVFDGPVTEVEPRVWNARELVNERLTMLDSGEHNLDAFEFHHQFWVASVVEYALEHLLHHHRHLAPEGATHAIKLDDPRV